MYSTFLQEQGFELPTPLLLCDSTSAVRVASRSGLGKLRHVELRRQALQQRKAAGRIAFQRVTSFDNPADVLTKYVDITTATRCGTWVGLSSVT